MEDVELAELMADYRNTVGHLEEVCRERVALKAENTRLAKQVEVSRHALRKIWDLGTDGRRGGPRRGAATDMAVIACGAIATIEVLETIVECPLKPPSEPSTKGSGA